MKDTKDTYETHVNRTYKSTVFAMLFTLLHMYALSKKNETDIDYCYRCCYNEYSRTQMKRQ